MEGKLIISTNTRGRYALEIDGEEWCDLSSGQPLEIKIGDDLWLSGRIEYSHEDLYATPGPQTIEEVARMVDRPRTIPGYYFISSGGYIIGLCAGMEAHIG